MVTETSNWHDTEEDGRIILKISQKVLYKAVPKINTISSFSLRYLDLKISENLKK
jgi:hypothetical protein